jgi:CheY-like chemotaxis protein
MTQSLDMMLRMIKVLIVDDEPNMRKVVRAQLIGLGVKTIHEAGDGVAGLDAIRHLAPDIVVLDWNMPAMGGADFIRAVRSPATFPQPDVPIIVLTGHGERSRVQEAVALGANEYLLKPVSSKALLARIAAILTQPRRMIAKRGYYGPEPRKLSSYKPELDPDAARLVLLS